MRGAGDHVVPSIVAAHLRELALCFGECGSGPPGGPGALRMDCDERCEAHLDGLRIAGPYAVNLALDQLERNAAEADMVIAAFTVLLQSEDNAHHLQVVRALDSENEKLRWPAWLALRLSQSECTLTELRRLAAGSDQSFPSAAAIDILAFHRQPVAFAIGDIADDETGSIAWLLIEAAGRVPRAWGVPHLCRFLEHPIPLVRDAALRASARAAMPQLLAIVREAVDRGQLPEAARFLGIIGARDDLARLERAASNPMLEQTAIEGLGALGCTDGVPVLLDLLARRGVAEAAAAAFTRITGADVSRLSNARPPEGTSEDDLDFWKPDFDVEIARVWWATSRARFDAAKRWQHGLNASGDQFGNVFDKLPRAVAHDLYLRQRALIPGTPDWEFETWPWKQRVPRAAPRLVSESAVSSHAVRD